MPHLNVLKLLLILPCLHSSWSDSAPAVIQLVSQFWPFMGHNVMMDVQAQSGLKCAVTFRNPYSSEVAVAWWKMLKDNAIESPIIYYIMHPPMHSACPTRAT